MGNGTLGNGALRNGTLGNGTLGNGTLGNGIEGDGTLGNGIEGYGTLGNDSLRNNYVPEKFQLRSSWSPLTITIEEI